MPMGKRYISAYAECPFYHSEDGHKIYCEGVVDGSAIHLAFGSPVALKKYRAMRCCKDYKRCRIAKMLYEKHEEGGDE